MLFDSILYPNRKIYKRAYIYELCISETSPTQIRKLAQCGMNKIYKVQKKIAQGVPPCKFYKEPKRGRPPKMNEEIKNYLIANGVGVISDANLAQKINLHFNLAQGLARSTINYYRRMYHFEYKPPKQRQQLSEEHIMKRKTFVYSIFNNPTFPWNSIVFSDESRICLTNDGKWVWRRRGDLCPEIFADLSKFPLGIMVYGAIGHNYKSKLVFTSMSISSEVYAGNIELSGMFQDLENINYVFMQDGAPCHTSKKNEAMASFSMQFHNLLATKFS